MKADLIKYLRKINKKPSVQGKLLEQFISHGASTIPEMSKAIGVSLPTTTSALNELIKKDSPERLERKTILRDASRWFTTSFQQQATSSASILR